MQIESSGMTSADYRKFGLTTAAIVIALFGLLLPWVFSVPWPFWPWCVAAVLALLALLAPNSLRPVYRVWMQFGQVMNYINTRLILGILFYGLFLPVSLMMRIFGKDPMRRKLQANTESYRIVSQQEDKDNMERPY